MNFQNRIAVHYMIATAVIMALVFGVVFIILESTVYNYIDKDLLFEAQKHSSEVTATSDSIYFTNKEEWEEREHLEIQVNPVFIQLNDINGHVMDMSPNLKSNELTLMKESREGYFNNTLNNRNIRQIQYPVERNGKIKGFIIAAISTESAHTILLKLRNVLLVSYLVVLTGLYFISRYLAGRSIIPVKTMTATINRITQNNLEERVALPTNKDEIYELSNSFNKLLQRIEDTLAREKQFTSDASHELRTPLATLRGTLEVLIRKPRNNNEYIEKIKYSLGEINKMANTVEQLLLLARLENNRTEGHQDLISLSELIDELFSKHKEDISKKSLSVNLDFSNDLDFSLPYYYGHLVFENLLVNAIKYSFINGHIHIHITERTSCIECTIEDTGFGIRQEDLENIFESFYRSDAMSHREIPGNGLGLAIARKAAKALGATISVNSLLGQGSSFTVSFLRKS